MPNQANALGGGIVNRPLWRALKIGVMLLAMTLCNLTAAAAPVTIQVASLWNLPTKQAQGYVAAAEAFNREYPDVQVELVLGMGVDKFRVAFAGGAAPDGGSGNNPD